MKLEDRRKYLTQLLVDVQRARSIYMEAIGNDDASMAVAAELEPWLFDKTKCIVPALDKCLLGEPADIDVMNFSVIARYSTLLSGMAITSKRYDPEPEEIFSENRGKG